VVHKAVPTVLDGCLKMGGFLGFLKIFSSILNYIHFRLFKKELLDDFYMGSQGGSKGESGLPN
jgi:hypothetical protein